MRITSIRCTDFLSFDTEGIALDTGRDLTVVVGPNGAGKTNLVRAIDLVRAAVTKAGNPTSIFPTPTPSPEDLVLADYTLTGRHRGSSRRPQILLEIQLTTERERFLVTTFFRAAIVSSFLTSLGLDEQGVFLAGGWAEQQITPNLLSDLFSYTVSVSCPVHALGRWSVVYGFRSSDTEYGCVLSPGAEANRIRRNLDTGSAQQTRLVDRLDVQGLAKNEPIRTLPRDLSSLADLLPPPGESFEFTVQNLFAYVETAGPFRDFAEQLSINPSSQDASRFFGPGRVLWKIFDEGLVTTTNLRLPPRQFYPLTDISREPDLTDGSEVPLALHQLKNGAEPQREQFRRVRSVFEKLVGREAELEVVSDGIRIGASEDQAFRLRPTVIRDGYEASIDLAGQGMWEAAVLATLIAASRDKVIILDEPAAGLHPTLQRKLPAVLASAAGQVIANTHSPYLVPCQRADDLRSIIRISNHAGASRTHVFGTTEAADDGAGAAGTDSSDDAIHRMQQSTELRALLFAAGVVLVEGGTELGLLPLWLDQAARRTNRSPLDDENVAVFDVGGDKGFRGYIRFLHQFGIPWVIFADGSVFDPARRDHIFRQIARTTAQARSSPLGDVLARLDEEPSFDVLKKLGEQVGVFTLASTWEKPGETIETYLRQLDAEVFAQANNRFHKSKPRLGRYFATNVPCPQDLDSMFNAMLDHLRSGAPDSEPRL